MLDSHCHKRYNKDNQGFGIEWTNEWARKTLERVWRDNRSIEETKGIGKGLKIHTIEEKKRVWKSNQGIKKGMERCRKSRRSK